MNIHIRRAKPDEAEALTEIAHAAKRHWGYPERWIEHWRNELIITPHFIAENEMFVAVAGEEIIGCCALVVNDANAEIEHMWIQPRHMNAGLGRVLFLHAKQRAEDLNLTSLELSADPNAEGFYQRMGATRIGEVHSEIDGQPRILPRLRLALSP